MSIVLATRNQNKVNELRAILGSILEKVEITTLEDFPGIPDVDETEPTLEGNALKKARAVFQATGLPTLADDSGLEVFYLAKRPGVLSARYAGPGATYEQNNKKLLAELKGVPPRRRNAQFRCVIAFVGAGYERIAEGICRGLIAESPRGPEGFGYDPLFIPEGFEQTFAELPAEVKNRISHRLRALRSIIPSVQSCFV